MLSGALSDEELFCECAASPGKLVWEEFHNRFRTYVTAVVRRVLRTAGGEAGRLSEEDLVQEVIGKVLDPSRNALAKFEPRGPGSARAFLARLAVNHALDRVRGVRRERLRFTGSDDDGAKYPLVSIPERTPSAEAIERDLLLRRIDQALEESDSATAAQDREIFWLYYRQGMTAREISLSPWIPLTIKGVEASLFRTLKLLRGKFGTLGSSGEGQ